MNDCGKVTVLVTGGGGYVGSHACVQLLEIGYNVVVIDNCRNCHKGKLYFIFHLMVDNKNV